MRRALAAVLATGGAAVLACGPIVGQAGSGAPKNACDVSACELYDQEGARPTCTSSARCEVAGKPEYPYVLSISVPDGSFFAPGRTFLLRSQDLRGDGVTCLSPTCFTLPPIVEVSGEYRVSPTVPPLVGFPLSGGEVLPARVTYYPEIVLDDGVRREASSVGLPSSAIFADVLGPAATGSVIRFLAFAPAGAYRRVAVPTSPFDAAFPPLSAEVRVVTEGSREGIIPYFGDRFVVGAAPNTLDDPTGEAHTAQVKRSAGLDGFFVHLRDRRTERRLSSLRALGGTEAAVRLDTVGENGPDGALRDGIDIVVSPDERWVGVPSLVDRILAGAGFRLEYPEVPEPSIVLGRVEGVESVAANVTFVSSGIEVRPFGVSPQLVYRTSLRTDALGRFATVLPRGTYEAFVEPEDVARALGKTRLSVVVARPREDVVLRVRPRGTVSGKVRLADGRPMAAAEVMWGPSARNFRVSPAPWESPRSARTRTAADGSFTVSLDEGEYDVTIVPEPGSGFPRFVAPRRPVGPDATTIEDFVVGAPTRVAWTMKALGGQPIVRAVVRAFAFVSADVGYVEVGQALSDTSGQFELLLGPLPK